MQTLYLAGALAALAALASVGVLYLVLYGNPFARETAPAATPAAARVLLHEGGVQVVRAATREVVALTSDTLLAPGDTIETRDTGRASVTLADGSALSIRPDSLVTLADNSLLPDRSRSLLFIFSIVID